VKTKALVLVILMFALVLLAQAATQTATPNADDKAACCKGMGNGAKTMDCCKEGTDCCKDGKCCGEAKMCARGKDAKGGCCGGEMKDGKMSCCGGKMKGEKTAAKAGCCGDKCDRMKRGEAEGM